MKQVFPVLLLAVTSAMAQNRSTLPADLTLTQANGSHREQSYVAAKLNLANSLQANITANFEVSDESAYGSGETMDHEATVRAALASRPDYRAAEATVQAVESQRSGITRRFRFEKNVSWTGAESSAMEVPNR